MKNLEMIKSAFGVSLKSFYPFSGKKKSEAEVLIREAHRIGAYRTQPSVSSTIPLSYAAPKCLYGLALILAVDGDGPRLEETCETHLRLERVRVEKERDLKRFRDTRISELSQDNLVEVLGDAVVDRYNRAQKALSRAIRKEEEVFIGRWTHWGAWVVQKSQDDLVAEYWEEYFRAENSLKESLYSKILRLRKKFQD